MPTTDLVGDSAAAGFTKLAGELGKGLGKKVTTQVPTSALRAINRALGRTIITKYGTKRGAIALGRLLPFGIGAALGYGFNAMMVNSVVGSSTKFFSDVRFVELTD